MIKTIPNDVQDRINILKQNNFEYKFQTVDETLAEYINHFSDDWVEVFVLYNNESGISYFFRV